jgi:hypothetical protein
MDWVAGGGRDRIRASFICLYDEPYLREYKSVLALGNVRIVLPPKLNLPNTF